MKKGKKLTKAILTIEETPEGSVTFNVDLIPPATKNGKQYAGQIALFAMNAAIKQLGGSSDSIEFDAGE
jgi:hypothetical protein